MSYSAFIEMYAAAIGKTPEFLLSQSPLSFPVSSNERGKALVDMLGRVFEFNLRGKRVLDVGCAYGGLSIAMAEAGAKVSAIDVTPTFLEYARANADGVAEIDFHVVDASSISVRDLYPKGSFDLIVVNDVLEHIYDTTSLVANMDWLLNDKGLVYFKVPNGFSPRFIMSEGHRRIFGLTLLDPDCWFHMYPNRASIFYRPFAYFQALFRHHGLPELTLIDEEKVLQRFGPRKLKTQIKEIFEKARDYKYPNQAVRTLIRQGIIRFRDEFQYDMKNQELDFVRMKYGSYFFWGVFGRPGALPKGRTETQTISTFGSVAARSGPKNGEAESADLGDDALLDSIDPATNGTGKEPALAGADAVAGSSEGGAKTAKPRRTKS